MYPSSHRGQSCVISATPAFRVWPLRRKPGDGRRDRAQKCSNLKTRRGRPASAGVLPLWRTGRTVVSARARTWGFNTQRHYRRAAGPAPPPSPDTRCAPGLPKGRWEDYAGCAEGVDRTRCWGAVNISQAIGIARVNFRKAVLSSTYRALQTPTPYPSPQGGGDAEAAVRIAPLFPSSLLVGEGRASR